MSDVRRFIDANRERFLEELKQLCAIPSVMGNRESLDLAARAVADRLAVLGTRPQLLPTPAGPPVVYAEIGQGPRSILSYSHYDVQPEDPLDAWDTPPFELSMRNDRLYARGVGDDKGDLMARIHGIETYQALYGPLPLRFKFFVEGEEEQGSDGVQAIAARHADLLRSDGCLWEGSSKDTAERYIMYAGMKGGVFCQLIVEGFESDLHSAYAPVVESPAWRLVQALATLRTADGSLTVDGLMERWRPPTPAELQLVEQIPFDGPALRRTLGIDSFAAGVDDRQALLNFIYQPTCNICGLTAGYQGEGVKTIVPGRASAKLDLRLVPDLTPELTLELLRQHLDRRGYHDFRIVPDVSLRASRSDISHPFPQAATRVAEQVYGARPVVFPNHGGSGPMATLCDDLGMPGITAGVGYYGMNMHAPNENIRLEDYFQGIEFVVAFVKAWAQAG